MKKLSVWGGSKLKGKLFEDIINENLPDDANALDFLMFDCQIDNFSMTNMTTSKILNYMTKVLNAGNKYDYAILGFEENCEDINSLEENINKIKGLLTKSNTKIIVINTNVNDNTSKYLSMYTNTNDIDYIIIKDNNIKK